MTTYPQYRQDYFASYMIKSEEEYVEVTKPNEEDVDCVACYISNEANVKRILKRSKPITAKEFGEAFIEAVTALKDAVNECFAPQIRPETLHRISAVVNERA